MLLRRSRGYCRGSHAGQWHGDPHRDPDRNGHVYPDPKPFHYPDGLPKPDGNHDKHDEHHAYCFCLADAFRSPDMDALRDANHAHNYAQPDEPSTDLHPDGTPLADAESHRNLNADDYTHHLK